LNFFNRKSAIANLKIALFRVFDVDYLAAFIRSGLSIDAVRQLCFARIFVCVELRRFESVVRTSSARACV
jgi:hypothetical protein